MRKNYSLQQVTIDQISDLKKQYGATASEIIRKAVLELWEKGNKNAS